MESVKGLLTRTHTRSRSLQLASSNVYAPSTGGNFNLFSDDNNWSQADALNHYRGRVWSALQVIVNRTACQPLVVARKTSTKSSKSIGEMIRKGKMHRESIPDWVKRPQLMDQLEIVDEHPIIDMFANPNQMMVAFSMMSTLIASYKLTGRAYALMDRADERVRCYPLASSWVEPIVGESGFYERFKVCRPGSTGEGFEVERHQMIVFANPDPADPFNVLSPLEAIQKTVQADEAVENAQISAFHNGIYPGMAVSVGNADDDEFSGMAELTVQQRAQFMNWIRREVQGAQRLGMPVILDAVIKEIKPITTAPAEMEFSESAKRLEDSIYQGFGVNPISAGRVEGANRASSAIAAQHLVNNAVNPMLTLFSQTIQRDAVPFFDSTGDLFCWFEPATANDDEMKQRRWDKGLTSGVVTGNEYRQEVLGIATRDEFDKPVTMTNLNPATPTKALGKLTKKSVILREKEQWLKRQGRAERVIAKQLSPLLNSQTEQLARHIAKLDSSDLKYKEQIQPILDEVLSPKIWTPRILEEVMPTFASLTGEAAASEYDRLLARKNVGEGVLWTIAIEGLLEDFELSDELRAAIRAQLDLLAVQEFWESITLTTQQLMATKIGDAIDDGKFGPSRVAKLVEETFGEDFNRKRALKVARTETVGALNAAHYETHQVAAAEGVIKGRSWLTIQDSRLRDTHNALESVEISNGEMFNVGGTMAPHPGHFSLPAAERIHCRCTTLALL